MKNNNYVFNSIKVITSILLVFVLIAQMPMNVRAQMASAKIDSFLETSIASPQRLSATISDNTVSVQMYDENVSDDVSLVVIMRNKLDPSRNLTWDKKSFCNHNCNISINMERLEDGNYNMCMWEYKGDDIYDNYVAYEIKKIGGTVHFYSANGQGQIDFMNWINAFYDPENYRGMSYWVQTTSNYDEIAEMTRNITAYCSSDEEKIRVIHDWICTNIAYDYEAYNSGDLTYRADASWVYNNRRGVCSGFSRLASVMLTAVGIPKMNVQGHAYNMEENVEFEFNHEWNLVYYNGSWHIFDFTHDSKNAYYGNGDGRNITGREPVYNNYDITPFASGMKYLTMNTCDAYNYDGYGESVYRLYNRFTGEHFYTFSYDETNKLIACGWRYEGVSWKSPLRSSAPVHRLFNPISGEHHFTMDWNEAVSLAICGWNYEGIAWYSDDEARVPVYRVFNPNAKGPGSHHYTTDFNEAFFLALCGWNYEGIGWYGSI